MALSPFRSKYDQMPHYKSVKKVELVCLKDGSRRLFLDDGPFPQDADGRPVVGWQTKTPQSGRAGLIKKIRQRETDPLLVNEDPDAKVAIFVFDGKDASGKPLPLPKIWDPRIGDYVEPVRMTDHHRKVMEVFIAARNEIEIRANERREQLKAEQEAKAQAGVEAMMGQLASFMQKAQAPKAPRVAPRADGGAA